MYIFKSDPLEASGENSLKLSKPVLSNLPAIDSAFVRLQAGITPIQITSLTAAAPAGAILSNLVDSVVDRARYIDPLTSENGEAVAANESAYLCTLANEESKLPADVLSSLSEISTNIIPIVSLSEFVAGSAIQQEIIPTFPANQAELVRGHDLSLDLSLLPPGAPVKIVGLSDLGAEVTVINKDQGNIHINDVKLAQALSEALVNISIAPTSLSTPQAFLSSLSLSEKFELKLGELDGSSGITVSGNADSNQISIFISNTDALNSGNGDNFIFASGAGVLDLNLGAGSNSVIIASSDLGGVVNFSTNQSDAPDFIAVVANGSVISQNLDPSALVAFSGLTNGPTSSDAIAFLGDMNSELSWAGGSAKAAQVQTTQTDLNLMVDLAQSQASQAHSVAWFHFEGATYILETRTGAEGSRSLDTLVKLIGVYNFSGADGELTPGMLHLLG